MRLERLEIVEGFNELGAAAVAAGKIIDLAVALAARYYPEARASAKLILAADTILLASNTKDFGDVAPRYLDRRGRSRDGG